jgi:hypothetical protein
MKILHRTCQLALSGLLLVGLGSISCTVAFAQTSPVVDSGWDSPTNTSLSAAGRFLNQATFGPTVNNILYVESNGIAASVDEQLGVAAYQIPLADPNPDITGGMTSFSARISCASVSLMSSANFLSSLSIVSTLATSPTTSISFPMTHSVTGSR